jgi:hypothetical protein
MDTNNTAIQVIIEDSKINEYKFSNSIPFNFVFYLFHLKQDVTSKLTTLYSDLDKNLREEKLSNLMKINKKINNCLFAIN